MRSLRVRRGRVSIVGRSRLTWIVLGGVLIAAYAIVGIPLSLYDLRHSGSVSGLTVYYALGGLALVLPGMLIILRLGLGRRTRVVTLLVDEEVDEGVLLAVVDAERELAEFLVRPRTAGQCRTALGAPPPSERL